MIRSILAAMALAHAAAGEARTACIQPADAEALVATLLPDMLTTVADRCEPTLPAGSTFRREAGDLTARWRTEVVGLEKGAAAALQVFMGEQLKGADPAAMMSLTRTVLVNEIAKDVKPAACPTITRVVGLVAPLPVRNIAGLIVLAFQEGATGRKSSDLPICKAVTR